MKRLRRPLKWTLIGTTALIGIGALTLMSLATAPVRSVVKRLVLSQVSSEAMQIAIDDIDGWPPFAFTLKGLKLSDKHGVFATMGTADIAIDGWALLRGRVALPKLKADMLHVERLPDLPPSEAPPTKQAERSLPALALGELAIDRLSLGQPLIGQAATLNVTGGATLDLAGEMLGAFKINRIDGKRGVVTLDLKREDATKPFNLALNVDEEANGLLTAALGQESGPAYKLALTGEGEPQKLGGRLTLTTDGADHLQAAFSGAPLKDGWSLSSTLSGQLQALVPAAVDDLVAGPLSGTINAELTDSPKGRRLAVADSALTISALALTMKGVLAPEGDDATFSIKALRPDGKPMLLAGNHLGSIDLNGRILTKDGRARADVTGAIKGTEAQGWGVPHLGLSVAAESATPSLLTAKALPFGATLVADAITSPKGRMSAKGDAPIRIELNGEAPGLEGKGDARLQSASLVWPGGTLGLTGEAGAAGASGKAEIALSDTEPLDDLLGGGLPQLKSLALKADGVFFKPKADAAFVLAGTLTDLALKEDAPPVLPGDTSLAAKVSHGPSGLRIDDLAIHNQLARVDGGLSLVKDTLAGTLRAAMDDLSRLSPAIAGKLSVDAKIAGTPALPVLMADIAIPSGKVGKHPLEGVKLVLATEATADNTLNARLALTGRYADNPLTGKVTASRSAKGVINAPEIALAIGANTVSGAVRQSGAATYDGKLQLAFKDLSEILALALMEGEGRGNATLTLSGEGGKQAAVVAADLTGLSVAGTSIGKLDIDARGHDLLGVPRLDGTVNATALRSGDFGFNTLNAKASAGADGATTFEVKGNGKDADINAAGRLDPLEGGKGFRLKLNQAQAAAQGLTLRLTRPAEITKNGNAISVDAFNADLSGGQVSAQGQVMPTLKLDAKVASLPAAIANRFAAGLEAKGTVNATAQVTGTPEAPKADWTVKLGAIHVAAMAKAGVPPLDIAASGAATKAKTSVEAAISGAGAKLNVGGHVTFSGPLDLKVTGLVPLAPLGAASGQEVRLGGSGNVDIAVAGTMKKPVLGGRVDLVDVLAIDGGTGAGVKDTRGRLTFRNNRLGIENVAGSLIQGGTFTANGHVDVAPGGQFPADLKLAVQNGRYNDGRMVNASFTANLAVSGALMGRSQVKGAVDLGKVEVAVPDRIGASPVRIAVQHRNGGNLTTASIAPKKKGKTPAFGSAMGLDVQVNAHNGMFVRGGGLDAELGGAITVKGTVMNPALTGAFDMQRGRIEFLGKRLDFTRGKVQFFGDLEPTLDFSADSKAQDVTITVGVTGPASKPDLKFTSNPELNSEEVLSRLLFNKGVGNLSPLQVAQLVSALATLTGVTKGPGPLERMRAGLGVDDLDVQQDAKGNTKVGVGKRINDKMRLGVEQGSQPGSTKAVIDLDITRNVKARGEAGSNGSGKLGIAVEKEY